MPTLSELLTTATTTAAALIAESPDRCSIVTRTESSDGRGGTTISETTAGSSIPVIYQEMSSSTAQTAGQAMSHVTHELFLLSSSAARTIAPSSKIVVAARGSIPELTFEQPVRLEETFSPLVHIGAMLKL